jgi:hypothetical protein
MTTNFFSPMSFIAVFGSGIRDPGSGMGKNKDPGSGIGDKHPGSATLRFCITHHLFNFEFCNILMDLYRRNDLIQLRDANVQSYSCQNILGELIF